MKKFLIITFLATTALIYSCGESTTSNIKTDKHQLVSGTHIFMIPPAGFTANTMGFSKVNEKMPENDAFILINEKHDQSYSAALKGLEESMSSEEGKILSKEDVKIGAFQGQILTTESYLNETKSIILFFGNDKFHGWVISNYNKKNEADGDEIKKAINSIVYDDTDEPKS